MTKIKFCHLIEGANFNPLLYNSIKYSDRGKFEYTVISFEPEDRLQEQMRELAVRSFSINHTSRRQAAATFWRLYRIFRRERFDVVQTHLFEASLIGLAAARAAGVPLKIFTGHHSHEMPLYQRPFLTFVDGISGRWLADRSVAPSIDMREGFIREQRVAPRKIEVLHHGFDLESWRAEARSGGDVRKQFALENKIVFGAVGRLFWVKDFENLIKAFADLAGERDDVALMIVGGGDRQEALEKLIADLNLRGKVVLTGRREDIAAVINSFDVFVHSALAESFGMVHIEALALGKPVISTPVGIAPEIIENGVNGFLVPAQNPGEMARAMRSMLEKRDEWQKIDVINREIADRFAVRKTQAVCDDYYLKWLQEKRKI